MPRKPRIQVEGGIFHVYARRVDRWRLFVDDDDHRAYLRLLAGVVERQRWFCLAYCLMPNHIHLLVETPHGNLARGMQILHGRYVELFNARHDRTGHLFERRYGSSLVGADDRLPAVASYIAENPVVAELCATPADWPWSSTAAAVAARPPRWLSPDRLRAHLAGDAPRRRTHRAGETPGRLAA